MGAWGYKALESDEGLDLVEFLSNYITELPTSVELKLTTVIAEMIEEGFLAESFDDIDFFYDHSAMALVELYLMFKQNGVLDFTNEDESQDLSKKVTAFSGDKDSFEFLLHHLKNIKNEVPDEDGEREIVSLWKDSDNYAAWQTNLDHLIAGLENEIQN